MNPKILRIRYPSSLIAKVGLDFDILKINSLNLWGAIKKISNGI